MKAIAFFLFFAGSVLAQQTREFPQTCAALFPQAAQTLIGAGFRTTISDSAGGILTADYTGAPLVYNFFYKPVVPYLVKYVEGGERYKNHMRGLTVTSANLTFAASENACKLTATIGLAGIDLTVKNSQWIKTAKALPSNGTMENEFLDRIGGDKR